MVDSTLIRATALSDAFAILAIMTEFPTDSLAQGLSQGALMDDMRGVLTEVGVQIPSTIGKMDEYRGRPVDEVLHELRCEYTRLFNHPERPAVQLYEGQFLFDQEASEKAKQATESDANAGGFVRPRLFVNPASIDAAREYRVAGMMQPDERRIPADAMPVQMDFMSQLYKRLAHAEFAEDVHESQTATAGIEEFAHYHLSKWMEGFYTALGRESESPAYRATGEMGAAVAGIVLA